MATPASAGVDLRTVAQFDVMSVLPVAADAVVDAAGVDDEVDVGELDDEVDADDEVDVADAVDVDEVDEAADADAATALSLACAIWFSKPLAS
ncbi:MAG TPA: hypothetical protein VF793_01005 [Telluria sp.]